MAQTKPVKTAIIGCGTISHIYMTNLKNKFRIIELVGRMNVQLCIHDFLPMRSSYHLQIKHRNCKQEGV